MAQIAEIILLQSGPLTEFGELEQGDQIVVESFKLDIDKIEIIVSYGDEIKQFTLKVWRAS
ncbi:MAG: hypothetical protein M0R80_02440 [Proteobacteria bacterium]|nr:hypothetical protein [Pseudomonadota bacterium]